MVCRLQAADRVLLISDSLLRMLQIFSRTNDATTSSSPRFITASRSKGFFFTRSFQKLRRNIRCNS